MADKITKKHRSWNMSRIKARDTKPELRVRKYLYSKGFRYRINFKITGKPDIVIPAHKIATFIHGCFWHQHGCKDTYRPKSRKQFWNKKLDGNIERDKKVKEKLQKDGWHLIYIWECEVKYNFEKTMKSLLKQIKKYEKGNNTR